MHRLRAVTDHMEPHQIEQFHVLIAWLDQENADVKEVADSRPAGSQFMRFFRCYLPQRRASVIVLVCYDLIRRPKTSISAWDIFVAPHEGTEGQDAIDAAKRVLAGLAPFRTPGEAPDRPVPTPTPEGPVPPHRRAGQMAMDLLLRAMATPPREPFDQLA